MSEGIRNTGDLIIYETVDGRNSIECRLAGDKIRLSQALMVELFNRSKKTISEHLQNLFSEGELVENSVVRNFRTAAAKLIVSRADPEGPNMALTSWSGSRVRKQEAIQADHEDLTQLEELEKQFEKKEGPEW